MKIGGNLLKQAITPGPDSYAEEASPTSSRQPIRTLDSAEEFFWFRQQVSNIPHTVAVRVAGAVDLAHWQIAWRGLHRRYALLSASISKKAGQRPEFVHADWLTEMEVRPWTPRLELCREMEARLTAPFGDGGKALMRLTLFHGPEESALLLTAHHSAADGKTNLMILRDLLASVAGKPPVGEVSWLSPSGSLHRPDPAPYVEKSDAKESQAAAERRAPGLPGVRVAYTQWSSDRTQKLILEARANGTTLQGALVAAFSVAFGWRRDHGYPAGHLRQPVRCATPIDLRAMANAPDASGLLIVIHVGSVPYTPERDFWDLARWVTDDLKEARTLDGAAQLLETSDRLTEQEQTPAQFMNKLRSGSGMWELMVTNNGSQFQARYGHLRATALVTGVASGAPSVQTVSAVTLDGALGMAHISRQPMGGLLAEADDILAGA